MGVLAGRGNFSGAEKRRLRVPVSLSVSSRLNDQPATKKIISVSKKLSEIRNTQATTVAV